MSALRQRMLEDLRLRGLAPKTQAAYVGAVRQLVAHCRKPPDQICEDDLRQYFLYLHDVKRASRSTSTLALCGIKFFFQHTLRRDWPTLDLVRPPHEKKLPTVLSAAEVGQILAGVHRPAYRVCLTTIYACGLRLLEGVRLQVGDVDGERRLLHLRHAKGNKDRYVPLPERCLALLRAHWRTHRHPTWLFPSPYATAARRDAPMGESGLQRAFRAALRASGLAKAASVHTLRHSCATHLLEAGVREACA